MPLKIACLVLGFSTLALAAPATVPTSQPAPAEVTAAIDQAIKMLEAKEYEALLDRFIEPAAKKRLLSRPNTTIKSLAEDFAGTKAEKLLAVLKWARTANAVVSDDAAKATYARPGRDLEWVKVQGVWYIAD